MAPSATSGAIGVGPKALNLAYSAMRKASIASVLVLRTESALRKASVITGFTTATGYPWSSRNDQRASQ